MLYLYENITIVSRFQEEFWRVMGTDYVPDAEANGQRLVGMFMVGIHYNENLALWEVDDWSAFDRLQEFHDNDHLAKVWERQAVDYRTDFVGKVLEPSPCLADTGSDEGRRLPVDHLSPHLGARSPRKGPRSTWKPSQRVCADGAGLGDEPRGLLSCCGGHRR